MLINIGFRAALAGACCCLLPMVAIAAPAAPAPPAVSKSVGSEISAPIATPAGEAAGRSIGYLTGAQLGRRCTDESTAGISYCYAFITGVHDTMQAYERWLGQKEFCPDASVAQGELRQNFLAYLNAYPSNGQGQAASVVVVALKTSFPCKVQ